MMKVLILSPKNRTTYNFRGGLIKEIIALGHEVIVTGPNFDNIKEVKKLGVTFVLVPLKKSSIGILGDIKYIQSIYKLLRSLKPQIVLAYTIKPVIYGNIAARLAGIKNFYSLITGLGFLYTSQTQIAIMLKPVVSLLINAMAKNSKRVIFQNSDDLRDFVSRRLVKPNKCSVVNGSGVNLQMFTPHPLPANITFLMISRMLVSKGVREYLSAARTVKAKYPNVKFVLVGAFENQLDSLAHKELQPDVERKIIEYHADTNDVRPFYQNCSVYVLPSYREGTPRTVLEAMATARPIITTDAPGCRQTVEDAKNGFTVQVKDANAVAEKMEWFIQNPEKIQTFGQQSLRICREKYDEQKVNRAMLKIMKLIN